MFTYDAQNFRHVITAELEEPDKPQSLGMRRVARFEDGRAF
jgi:hypothetical protein